MPSIKLASEAEWLAVRESNVGGSEVAGLFARWQTAAGVVTLHGYEEPPPGARYIGSCSPYHTPYSLFTGKAGIVPPADFNVSERMEAGSHLEPAIAAWASDRWAWKLRKVRRYHSHPTVQGWGASVDFESHDKGMAPVEIKNVDGLVAKRDWVIEGEDVLSTPLHILLQLQHYIGARSAEGGWIIGCVGGNALARGYFPRHEETQGRISAAVRAFWAGVAANVPPVGAADYAAVAEEFSLGGGEVVDLSGEPGIDALIGRYQRWKRHLDSVELTVDNLKARIAVQIGEAPRATTATKRLSWPVIHREEKMIAARLQSAKSYRGGLTISAAKEAKQ